MNKQPNDGVYINPELGIILSCAQRRQVKKNAERTDLISNTDRRFFERFPHRKHRVRLAGVAEVEQQKLVCGSCSNPTESFMWLSRTSRPGTA